MLKDAAMDLPMCINYTYMYPNSCIYSHVHVRIFLFIWPIIYPGMYLYINFEPKEGIHLILLIFPNLSPIWLFKFMFPPGMWVLILTSNLHFSLNLYFNVVLIYCTTRSYILLCPYINCLSFSICKFPDYIFGEFFPLHNLWKLFKYTGY